jgi:Protein-tyrosine-phosphatase
MGKLLDARKLPTRSADEHRSRPVTPAMLETADLVLTAEGSHCAVVAQLAPLVIPHTFTIRDAAGLASFVVSHVAEVSPNGARLVPGAPPLPPATSSELRIDWLISEMNESRGLAAPFPPAGRSLRHPRRQPSDVDPDVPDPHAATRVSHTTAFRLLDGAVDSLAANITRLLEL